MDVERGQQTPGEVWQAFEGPNLDLVAYVVSERGKPERIIAVAPFIVADESGGDSEERANCLEAALAVARDPATARTNPNVIDYGCFGRIDSVREMPSDPYAWVLGPIGKDWGSAKTAIFPFCRFRIAQMLGLANFLPHDDMNRMDLEPTRRRQQPCNEYAVTATFAIG